ncbi:hypothetical protein HanXRQr2_Chr08g0323601 [Helianthus annuus]|uniref:Uncharacterized protein n=1 Tax=Helianthus annuus TaxID=4232 RepID=A0A251U2C4_HELAN|nr:hypothetical protein HanXRQr2_Chr08g0323601 [Helianthus annuus]
MLTNPFFKIKDEQKYLNPKHLVLNKDNCRPKKEDNCSNTIFLLLLDLKRLCIYRETIWNKSPELARRGRDLTVPFVSFGICKRYKPYLRMMN